MTPRKAKASPRKGEEMIDEHLTTIIEREVSYFNGWWVSEDAMRSSCYKAALKILRYLKKRQGKPPERRRGKV